MADPDTDTLSYLPLADAVDTILGSLDTETASKRAQRTARNLRFQSQALRSVGTIPLDGFARADWSLGQQATIAIPLMARSLRAKSGVAASAVDVCIGECESLAATLKAIAEGRPLT